MFHTKGFFTACTSMSCLSTFSNFTDGISYFANFKTSGWFTINLLLVEISILKNNAIIYQYFIYE